MTHPLFDMPLEMKFLSETGVFEGYASVFNVIDRVGDRIARGAFEKSLADFRQESRLPPLLWQHDASQPIGAWREIYEDSHGLFVRGELFIHEIARAKAAYKLLKENVVTGLSIGYRARDFFYEEKSGTGVRVLTDVELLEVSMVTFPANEHARINGVKSALAEGKIPTEREFESFLREAGLSRRQAKALMAQGYKCLAGKEENDDIGTDMSTLAGIVLQALREE